MTKSVGLAPIKQEKQIINANNFSKPATKLKIKITPQRRKMINETVNAMLQSNNNKVIACKLLNISERALYKRIENYPVILEKMKQFTEKTVELARRELESNSIIAVSRVTNLMNNSRSERIILDSAVEVLDRSGITKPNNQIQVNVLNDLRKDKEEFNL